MTKLFKAKHPKEKGKQQHCPSCNSYIKYIPNYPVYICAKCIEKATDKAGKAVMFKTIAEEGQGVQGIYRESGKLYRSRTCYINGIKCKVEEIGFAVINERRGR